MRNSISILALAVAGLIAMPAAHAQVHVGLGGNAGGAVQAGPVGVGGNAAGQAGAGLDAPLGTVRDTVGSTTRNTVAGARAESERAARLAQAQARKAQATADAKGKAHAKASAGAEARGKASTGNP